MSQTLVFRCITIGSLLLGWLAAVIDFIPGLVPENVVAAVESNLQPGQLFVVALASVAVAAAAIVATFGLAFFQAWSRPVALGTTVASLALYPFTPAMPLSGWAAMLFYLSALTWGIALALAYQSPLSARFSKGF